MASELARYHCRLPRCLESNMRLETKNKSMGKSERWYFWMREVCCCEQMQIGQDETPNYQPVPAEPLPPPCWMLVVAHCRFAVPVVILTSQQGTGPIQNLIPLVESLLATIPARGLGIV